MKDFLRESSWSVEVVHFLLFSPVLLVSTLRFMTAYVTLGRVAVAEKQPSLPLGDCRLLSDPQILSWETIRGHKDSKQYK